MDAPRRIPLHPSLVRPLFLLGGERELTILNWTLVAMLAVGGGVSWATLLAAGFLATAGQWALTRLAKHDPQARQVYLRHLRYQPYYPARALVQAPRPIVRPSVP